MSFIQLDIILRCITSPVLVLTAALIIISSVRMWRNYHIDKPLCVITLLVGIVLLLTGIAGFISNPF